MPNIEDDPYISGVIADATSVASPPDMSKQYNTVLTPQEELAFQQWAQAKGHAGDVRDYDLRGAYKAGAGQADNGHFPDTYKKPNHPTFSNESQYSGKDGYEGGQWQQQGDKWIYNPSQTNVDMYGPKGLQNYFTKTEPDSVLVLPK